MNVVVPSVAGSGPPAAPAEGAEPAGGEELDHSWKLQPGTGEEMVTWAVLACWASSTHSPTPCFNPPKSAVR